jgi:hypothetical protein
MDSYMLTWLQAKYPDKDYPANLGEKWTIEEENILLQELDDDIDIELIAQAHKRTLGGIIGRQKFIAYNMYLAKAPEDLILRKTKINKLQLLKVIAKKEKVPKSLAAKPPSLEYEVVEMRKEIRELKTTVSELVEMLKAIYEFEDT